MRWHCRHAALPSTGLRRAPVTTLKLSRIGRWACLLLLVGGLPATSSAQDAPNDPPEDDLGHDVATFQPTFEWMVYGSVQFEVDEAKSDGVSFVLRPVDLFTRAHITESISLLGELIIGNVPKTGVAMLHPARFFLKYTYADWMVIRAGVMHTPLGYYTPNFPHGGEVFRLASRRPRMLDMDVGRRMLPNHILGLTVGGSHYFSLDYGLRYDLTVGNSKPNSLAFDTHRAKLVAFRVAAMLDGIAEGLEIGVSGLFNRGHIEDLLVGGFHQDGEEEPVVQTMGVGYLAWNSYPVEAVFELVLLRHAPEFLGSSGQDLIGAWGQFGYSLDWVTPYARYEQFKRARDDEAFNAVNAPVRYQQVTAGLRFSVAAKFVLRVEYGYDFENRDNRAVVQTSFSF